MEGDGISKMVSWGSNTCFHNNNKNIQTIGEQIQTDKNSSGKALDYNNKAELPQNRKTEDTQIKAKEAFNPVNPIPLIHR